MKRADLTLGILAGGQGSRLGGIDKAWLRRDGVSQVERHAARLAPEVARVVVSANRGAERYRALGLAVVADAVPGLGPLGGLHALAHACATPWLLTLPVDLYGFNDCLLRSLLAAGPDGASAEDEDGPQPLVALWPVQRLRAASADALQARRLAVQALQRDMGLARCRFPGVRFGNLNTPDDLTAAGVGHD